MGPVSSQSTFQYPDLVTHACHVCSKRTLEAVPRFKSLSQVTSDCRPWPAGSQLCVCRNCGSVQKLADAKWKSDAERIYSTYAIYHQGDGTEQSVFDKTTGHACTRSSRLLHCFKSCVGLSDRGHILDVGCGNGGLLRSFAEIAPLWSLAGTELDNKYRQEVEGIAEGTTLYTCPPEQISNAFDLITLVHVLEHVVDPVIFLRHIGRLLETDGALLIDVPDFQQNPFDLLIADHCTHFTLSTILYVLKEAGFEPVATATDWVPKEISVVARKRQNMHDEARITSRNLKASLRNVVDMSLQWILSFLASAKQISAMGSMGIFGTSIAATWLDNEIGESVLFFVDEDPARVGKTYMGRPIYHPLNVPDGSRVFIALPYSVASVVYQRLVALKVGADFFLPLETPPVSSP